MNRLPTATGWLRLAAPPMILLSLATGFLAGCGSTPMQIEPVYDNEHFHDYELRRGDIQVIRVLDNRGEDPRTLGRGKPGWLNRTVAVELTEPVDEFVRRALEETLGRPAPGGRPRPIAVRVDTLTARTRQLLFKTVAVGQASLVFEYLGPAGEIISVRSRSEVEKWGLLPAWKLDDVLYECLAGCTRSFLSEVADTQSLGRAEPEDDLAFLGRTAAAGDRLPVVGSMDSDQRVILRGLNAAYFRGDKIRDSYHLTYQHTEYQRDSSLGRGFGVGLRYCDVLNEDDGLDGRLLGPSFPVTAYWYLGRGSMRLYLASTWEVIIGSEFLEDPDEVNFFVGLQAEPKIGLALCERFALEGGVFGSLLWGSDLWPEDFGWRAGLVWNFR